MPSAAKSKRHLQALAEKARKDGTLMPFDPSQRTLNQQRFRQADPGDEGRSQAPAGWRKRSRRWSSSKRMLEQLKQAEANPGQDRQQSRQQRQRGQQQMGAAEDMVQREGAMKGRAAGRQDAG